MSRPVALAGVIGRDTMLKPYRLLTLLLLAALALGAVPAVLAQEGGPGVVPPAPVTDDQVNAIAKQLYCPVCENVPLDVCGTKACADWRDEIRAMLEDGRSEEEIKAYFTDRYGRRVLATPDARGIDVVIWVMPVVAVIGGAALLVTTLRRMAPGTLQAVTPPDVALSYEGLDPEYVARFEAEYREFTSS
ncbi:MAG: hypothetical protein Kow00124_23800 [Anaerolineae bacterium]